MCKTIEKERIIAHDLWWLAYARQAPQDPENPRKTPRSPHTSAYNANSGAGTSPKNSGGITDASGSLAQTLEYYPFGAVRTNERSTTLDTKRKFIGEQYDAEVALNYLNARYYDPVRGQFLSQDPLFIGGPSGDRLTNPQSLNSYAYANNNPINYLDPSGLRAQTEQEANVAHFMLQQFSIALSNGNTSSVQLYSSAYGTYTSSIAAIPTGSQDPAGFTIANNAVSMWYDAQKGYDNGNWSQSTPTLSKYYSTLPAGKNTCTAFVGEVIGDAVGPRDPMNVDGLTMAPNTKKWLNDEVQDFAGVGGAEQGDVVVFSQGELFGHRTWFSTGHAGIYFGDNLYISANTEYKSVPQRDVVIKPVPADNWSRTSYYYRYNNSSW